MENYIVLEANVSEIPLFLAERKEKRKGEGRMLYSC